MNTTQTLIRSKNAPLKRLVGMLIFLMLLPTVTFPQTLKLQDNTSRIQFSIKNFGLTVSGTLKGLTGQFVLNEDSIAKSRFEAVVRAGTIDTGISLRDKHLRDKNYFDAQKYPTIKITSRQITKINGQWSAIVDITIRHVTRQATIPFTMERLQNNYIFQGRFNLNRQDFQVGGNSFSLSDSVSIQLEIMGTIVN